MDRKFWEKRKVFITGHTGFKGSWLSLWLQEMGAELSGYALAPPTDPNLFDLAHVATGMSSVLGDVRNYDSLKEVIAQRKPEIIIHMAAQSIVRYSYDNPIETYSTNVMGTVNLLQAVRELERRCALVIVTSDKCYQNNEWVWGYRENDALGGHDPYSNSKACAELVTSAFRKSFFQDDNVDPESISVATARAGNVIGGGDWTTHQLVPDIMTAFMEKRPVSIRNPSAIRPWLFVMEPLCGYLTLAQHLWACGEDFAGAWNFGPENNGTQSVSWIVKNLSRLWGDGSRWEIDEERHPQEAHTLRLDSSKTKRNLGWAPKLQLAQALEWVVHWYKAYQRGEDVRALTEAQISKYEVISDKNRD